MKTIKIESLTLVRMIGLFCKGKHGTKEGLCDECASLLVYSHEKLIRCPFSEAKPSCRACAVHCYAPKERENIRAVMQYSGPRMFIRHPILAFYYLRKLFVGGKNVR